MSENQLSGEALNLERQVRTKAFKLVDETGDYKKARELLQVAEDIGLMASRLDVIEGADGSALQREQTQSSPRRRSTHRAVASRGRYPQFFVEGDRLVKIGKGKQKSAKPYRHEATKETFEAVADWLAKRVESASGPIKAGDLNEELSSEYPSYQLYLVIAALAAAGVLASNGRGQYVVAGAGSSAQWWGSLQRLKAESEE